MTLFTLAASLAFATVPPPDGGPPAAPAAAPATEAASSPAVDEFLARLETAAADLRDFSAGIAYERYDALLDETERRFGRIVLEGQGKERKLAILFNEFIDGGGRADTSRDHWLFVDGWLIEINEKTRSVTERQVAPPGSSFDPLKLGEGPFPIPLGQPKAEVLRRFDVSELGASDAPLLASLPPCRGLKLVPRPDTDYARDAAAVEVWYEPETLSPLGLVIREVNGDRVSVRLSRPVRNGGLPADDRALLVRPETDPTKWSIDRRPLASEKAPS